ncbi:E4, partial [Rousettus aegyptiacus papillomavirus 1]
CLSILSPAQRHKKKDSSLEEELQDILGRHLGSGGGFLVRNRPKDPEDDVSQSQGQEDPHQEGEVEKPHPGGLRGLLRDLVDASHRHYQEQLEKLRSEVEQAFDRSLRQQLLLRS